MVNVKTNTRYRAYQFSLKVIQVEEYKVKSLTAEATEISKMIGSSLLTLKGKRI